MRSLFAFLFAVTFLAPRNSAAQSGSAVAPAGADTIAATAAAVVKKKKGGMFGKFKGLAKNKVVKTVAKTALCTVVPGGQVVAGALDAAETKNVAGAAGAAGAALSGGGGGGCMPGMPGMAAPTGPAAGGVGAAGVGALGAAASAAALPGQPSTGMPGMAMSPEQLKQMQEQYGKMGMDTAQLRAMQQMMAGLPGASQGAAAAPSDPAAATGGPALSREKGKMLLRQLPWVPGSDAVQQGGRADVRDGHAGGRGCDQGRTQALQDRGAGRRAGWQGSEPAPVPEARRRGPGGPDCPGRAGGRVDRVRREGR